MSPLSLRRYRAERLLRADFEALRVSVLGSVRASLGVDPAQVARLDLEACYATAWQALYAATVEGRQIANPAGWLAVVTRRRAIDELRAEGARSNVEAEHAAGHPGAFERDLPAELDDSAVIAGLLEGIRARLGPREREAAALCYLHGLTRGQAAACMGISERALRRLMEGGPGGRAGVAAKIGALADIIRAGAWCDEQRSLMRALAFGLLDPDGERYRIAAAHRSRCPACRAYVVSLRGLAAVLPPPLLPLVHGASGAAVAGVTAAHAAPTAGAAKGASAASAGSSAAAGGGWALGATPVIAKLTAACLVALGVTVGCAELTGTHVPRPPAHRDARARITGATRSRSSFPSRPLRGPVAGVLFRRSPAALSARPVARARHPRASAEFEIERPSVPVPSRPATDAVSLREFQPG